MTTTNPDDSSGYELRRLYDDGESLRSLAERYGCDRRVVRSLVLAAGGEIRPSGWNDDARSLGFETRSKNFVVGTCSIPNCNRDASGRRGWCDCHYRKWLHHGSPTWSRPPEAEAPRRGRLIRKFVGHPLASPATGRAYIYRVVLYDSCAGGRVPCFWCGRPLRWTTKHPVPPDGVCVDHLDHNRSNNLPTNLVPACNRCNCARSRWRKHKPPLVSIYRPVGEGGEFVWDDGSYVWT